MKSSGIGGQAVIEGIMMKNKDEYSVAVRKPDNNIEVMKRSCKKKKRKIVNAPFIRGIFAFIDSLVLGIKTLTYSASFIEEDLHEEEKSGDKVARSLFKEKGEAVLTFFTIFLSVVIAVAVFIVLPYFLSTIILRYSNIASETLKVILEGVLKIIIFIFYILLISKMKDIQRTFMYHGAEHKCINCIETGNELNVENVMKSSKVHKRCGTSFLFLVLFISIIFFIFIRFDAVWLRYVVRVALIPVIAAISYEIIRKAGNSNSKFFNIISKPGLWMQKLTTKEPDEGMCEVAIAAVEEVFDWKEYLKEDEDEIEIVYEDEEK